MSGIGERLKMARKISKKSQQALADDIGVSKMAISYYEKDKRMPSSKVLIDMARVMDISVEYLLRPVEVTLSQPAFRRRQSLPANEKKAIVEQTRDWLERYLDMWAILGESPEFEMPDINLRVSQYEDIERIVLALRREWQLGLDALDNLTEVLEDHHILVGCIEADSRFDSLTMWANKSIPVIIVNVAGIPGDRQRFNIARELGHALLDIADNIDVEKAAHRFAGAFLMPKPAVIDEYGPVRSVLSWYELHLLKHKYGLSMQALIFRAKDMDIINESVFIRLFRELSQKGWRQQEPGDQVPIEESHALKRMVLRALSEHVIGRSRAAELLGKPLMEFCTEESLEHDNFPIDLCA